MSTLGRAARVIDRTGLGRVLRRLGTWRGALVLTYHRMYRPGASPHAEPRLWSATQEGLDAQLSLLAREFDVVPARELGEGITSARGRVVVLTFDDGFRDNWELALPVLRSRGVPATFFLATGFIDDPRLAWWDELAWMVHKARNATMRLARIPRELSLRPAEREATLDQLLAAYGRLPSRATETFLDEVAQATGAPRPGREAAAGVWMTWDMARDLRDAGMGIGGHTEHHPILSRLPPEEQRAEIEGCRRRLGQELGVDMELFAYPVGLPDAFGEETKRILRDAGVRLAFSYYGGVARAPAPDPYDVPRASVSLGMPGERFRAMVTIPQLYARW